MTAILKVENGLLKGNLRSGALRLEYRAESPGGDVLKRRLLGTSL